MNKYKETTIRRCAVCGRKISIILYEKGHYKNGHYFGKLPVGKRSKEESEYWECKKCFNEFEKS